MNPRNWRVIAVALGGIIAVLGGVLLATVLLPGVPGASPAPAAGGAALPSVVGSQVAGGSPVPVVSASAALAPSGSVAPAPGSAAASANPTAGASPAAGSSSPTGTEPEPTATLTFLDLKLDGATDSKGQTRTINFSTDGPGLIQAQLITHAPQGAARMCLKAGSGFQACRNVANGTVVARAISGHNDWAVTLRGVGLFTPVTDIVLSFPARSPSVTLSHARLDGRTLENYNGIRVRVAPRADGNLRLLATWPSRSLVYGIELVNETTGAGNVSLRDQGPATETDQTFAVTGGATWRFSLRSQETGRHTDLSATITWP
jgi:hypothetical protein